MITKLFDPGKNLPPQAAEQARMNAWKRPAKKADRDALRAERNKMWEVATYGNTDSTESRVAR